MNVNYTKDPLNFEEIDMYSIDSNFMKNSWIWVKSIDIVYVAFT